ncbi:hypothetical protein JAAARDRAFT_28409 [Jaapia argillacea MUCL 33604]|uniref:Acetylornithine transaminase n=1 Tax=Jaapia argillacea MUCL 33604 TaxID=933084 RepID=A0A067QQ54_9AGAM|nr:hypothetical protein JAAARDRAFT_28409 [Jaapia argillacea MUCL 33604]
MMRQNLATARLARGRCVPTTHPARAVFGRLLPPSTTSSRWSSSQSESSPQPPPSLPSSPNRSYLLPTHTPTPFPPHSSSSSPQNATTEVLSLAESYLLPVYARPPIVLSHGKGSWVWDTEGRKYLDFSAGIAVNCLGHADDGIAEVLAKQSATLLHASNVYHNLWAAKLAQLLVELTKAEGGLGFPNSALPPPAGTSDPACGPEELEATSTNVKIGTGGAKVFFSNSGTEANEGALKIARKVGKDRWLAKVSASSSSGSPSMSECTKTEIVCFQNAFHGRSLGALSVTPNPKYQAPFAPLLPGVKVGKVNVYEGKDSFGELVGENTCAVIVEPIQGEGGVNPLQVEWVRELRKKCDEVGAVLIFDEVQCGLYRTGSLWAHSTWPVDCHPDIVTMAKPLAGGYPIGAVLMRDNVAETMTAGTHGTTFGGSPLACAVGHHVLSRISSRPFISSVSSTSAHLISRLSLLPKYFPSILEPTIRGRGLILGLGFNEKWRQDGPGKLVGMARERGVLLLTAGKDAVRLVPSLNVGQEEVDLAVDVMESCLIKMEQETE